MRQKYKKNQYNTVRIKQFTPIFTTKQGWKFTNASRYESRVAWGEKGNDRQSRDKYFFHEIYL
jgi:hypothetical protein